MKAVGDVWRHAARGDVSFVSAAFFTNVAHASLLKMDRRMRDIDEDITIHKLREGCCSLKPAAHDDDDSCDWSGLLERLSTSEQAVAHVLQGHGPIYRQPCLQRPADFIVPDQASSNASALVSTLVQNIVALVQSSTSPSAIVMNGSPVYADIGYAIKNDANAAEGLTTTLGMELLSQSYQSYVLSSPDPATVPVCRLSALRLAHAASGSIERTIADQDCFPCRCTQTIAFHLQNLAADLKSFAGQKCWDLYFQSPFVSGSHIVEILDQCQYYGSKLLVYRHYVGALVHSYNVLKQLAAIEDIPLLEYLRSTFADIWFPGGVVPTKNFRAAWTRYIGARLKFKKGHRRNKQDSWCMAVPPHAARQAAGLGVGRNELKQSNSKSLLFAIKEQGYNVADAQWDRVHPERARAKVDRVDTTSLALLLPMVEEELNPRRTVTQGPSKARLNYFDVFRFCVQTVRRISEATHTDPKEKGMNCICFVSAILEGADRIVDARSLGQVVGKGACWTKTEREGVIKSTVAAMIEVLRDKHVNECGWSF
jgi:hypothetical protein